MRTNKDLVYLHNHDEYSNLKLTDSIAKVKQLIDRAVELGQKGVAITDHNILSAHVEAINHVMAQKKKGKYPEGFNLILGNEIYLVDEKDMHRKIENKEPVKFYHFILLAKDEIGHRQIRELSSMAWERAFNYRGLTRTPNYYGDFAKVLGEEKGHIIASTACLGGMLGTSILKTIEDDSVFEDIGGFLEWCLDTFGEDDFFLEMQPSIVKYDENGEEIFNQQKFVNQKIVNCAKVYNLNTIITTDAHYILKEDRAIHEAYLKSDSKDSGKERELGDFYETTYMMDIEEIYKCLDYLDEKEIDKAIDNTVKICERIGDNKDYGLFHKPVIPLTPVPHKWEWFKFNVNVLEGYPNTKKLWEGENQHEAYLVSQVFAGIEEREIKPEDMIPTLARIEEECEIIVEFNKNNPGTHVGAYFTTMQVLVNKMWEISLVGCGRGSGVGFIINYLLGITQINPLKCGILMPPWRFLSGDISSLPDIDVDSASNLKEEVFDNCKKYFESIEGSFIRIATYSTLKAKSTIKTVCKGLGINNDEAGYIASLIITKRGQDQTITQSYYGDEERGIEVNKEFKNTIDEYANINLLEMLLKLEGLKCGCSSHASGVLPLNGKVYETNSIMRTPNGELVTAFDLHESEQLGNLKYDFLLITSLAPMQNCMEQLLEDGYIKWQGTLRKTYNKYFHPDVININQKEVWENISSGKVLDLFQFNSTVGKECIDKIKPENIIEMASANSLMRLQAEGEQPVDRYKRYKNNLKDWEDTMDSYGLTEEEKLLMHDIVDSEGGVMCSQEIMMMSCIKLCGFTTGEANKMRKIISKKKIKEIPIWKELYFKKGVENGKSENILRYNWEQQISLQLG